MIRIKELKPFTPNVAREGEQPKPINPFRQDALHMGHKIGENVFVMFQKHNTKDQDYVIVINTRTGERVGLEFTEKPTWPGLATVFAMGLPYDAAGSTLPDQTPPDQPAKESQS